MPLSIHLYMKLFLRIIGLKDGITRWYHSMCWKFIIFEMNFAFILFFGKFLFSKLYVVFDMVSFGEFFFSSSNYELICVRPVATWNLPSAIGEINIFISVLYVFFWPLFAQQKAHATLNVAVSLQDTYFLCVEYCFRLHLFL